MSNSDYVLGKTLGILVVFFLLNFFVLAIAAVMNLVNPNIEFDVPAYFLYPAIISLPTLVYILGLSFLLMILIRNQAVTIVVLLGYIASILFYLGPKFHFLFDYMAFSFPLMKSEFVGFGNLSEIIMQRGIYFCLGFSFIFLTVILFKRLPQSRIMTRVSWVAMILLFVASGYLVKRYMDPISQGKQLRENMVMLNNQYVNDPQVTVTRCDLDLLHQNQEIEVTARLRFVNNTGAVIREYIF